MKILVAAGGISVGVHAGLAPEHLHEWPARGAAFIGAAAAGAALVAAVAVRPTSVWPPRLLGALFFGLIVAYALTRLVDLSPLDPTQEPVDVVGVCTSAVEAVGLVLAARLGRRHQRRRLSLDVTTGGTA
jgi:hypothetical protein